MKQQRVVLHQGNRQYGDGGEVECEVLPESGQSIQLGLLTDSGESLQ